MRDSEDNWIGCLLWILIPLGIYFGTNYCSSRSKKERIEAMLNQRQNDSIRKAFILDSLAHDPHYQDSVRRAKEESRRWWALHDSICNKEIVGFVYDGDSIYHCFLHEMIEKEDGWKHNYSNADIPKIRFVTEGDIIDNSFLQCEECRNVNDFYSGAEEYIHISDIYEYVRDNSDDFKEIFEDEFYYEPDYDYYDDRW